VDTESGMNILKSSQPDFPVAFVDSSAIVALVDRDDSSHHAAAEAYRSLVTSGYRLFTTNHVINEAFELLVSGIGFSTARIWLQQQTLAVYVVKDIDLADAAIMVCRRDDANPLSLTDALSMVVMERLGVVDAFAVDPAFLAELS